jgi:linoleoyl-CoA desaturase
MVAHLGRSTSERKEEPPMTTHATPHDDRDRLERFGKALDAVRQREEALVGADDLAWIRRVDRFSRTMEVVGRVLIHVSLEPVTFSVGVVALWLHKQLQATEVGHTVLHGAFDRIEGDHGFRSERWWWEVPIDEEAWKEGHNQRHHQFTNVAGKDPDIHFGPVRLTEHTPYAPRHATQLPFSLLVLFPNFGVTMNAHFTGLTDLYVGNGRPERFDFLPDDTWPTVLRAHRRAWRKVLPYLGKEYVLFPLLAGPFFWKVLLGNWLSETLRDVYTAATIYCGHVGEDVASYPEGTRARGKGAWYAMQVEASHDFEVPLPISILCGALDRQIEHHLFPRLPTNRLRAIAPEVRRICEEHGVVYKTGTWWQVLKKALKQIARLSRRTPAEQAAADALGAVAAAAR